MLLKPSLSSYTFLIITKAIQELHLKEIKTFRQLELITVFLVLRFSKTKQQNRMMFGEEYTKKRKNPAPAKTNNGNKKFN